MPNGETRDWDRACTAMRSFRTQHGRWPSQLRLGSQYIANIRSFFTERSWCKLVERVEIVVGMPHEIAAAGRVIVQYGGTPPRDIEDTDVEGWLGVTPDAPNLHVPPSTAKPGARTSINSPIEVAWVTDALAPEGGRIGVTFAPGKKGPSVHGKPWDRDLAIDLERLVSEYETQLLVSLIEDHELTLLEIPALVTEAQRRGIVIVRAPVPDLEAPEQDQARHLADLAIASARAGRNVVIHCRGGLGRAGTLAACTLVALGQSPDDAINHVRRVRKGAIETQSQQEFVTNQR